MYSIKRRSTAITVLLVLVFAANVAEVLAIDLLRELGVEWVHDEEKGKLHKMSDDDINKKHSKNEAELLASHGKHVDTERPKLWIEDSCHACYDDMEKHTANKCNEKCQEHVEALTSNNPGFNYKAVAVPCNINYKRWLLNDNQRNGEFSGDCECTVAKIPLPCQTGHERHDANCVDVDECGTNTHNCHSNAACQDTEGSFECSCEDGYEGTGLQCANVDECTGGHNCHADATCTDTSGSFTCACNNGFTGDGVSCTNAKECDIGIHNCHADATCTDTSGSFTCACNNGFTGDGVTCSDFQECTNNTHNCHANATCSETYGSFTCACNNGFTGDGVTCSDFQECTNNTHNCHADANCTDTPGSFVCACNDGFTGDGVTCSDFKECNNTHNCHADANCTDTPGSFECVCKDGFTGDGVTCTEECKADAKKCTAFRKCWDHHTLACMPLLSFYAKLVIGCTTLVIVVGIAVKLYGVSVVGRVRWVWVREHSEGGTIMDGPTENPGSESDSNVGSHSCGDGSSSTGPPMSGEISPTPHEAPSGVSANPTGLPDEVDSADCDSEETRHVDGASRVDELAESTGASGVYGDNHSTSVECTKQLSGSEVDSASHPLAEDSSRTVSTKPESSGPRHAQALTREEVREADRIRRFNELAPYVRNIPWDELDCREGTVASGGQGKVYELKDGGRVKVFSTKEEWQNELIFAAQSHHPHIVTLRGRSEQKGMGASYALVYENLEGGDLRKNIRLGTTHFPPRARLSVAVDAARGLVYLHDNLTTQGPVVHADVKTTNVAVTSRSRAVAKLIDFGYSRQMKNAHGDVTATSVYHRSHGYEPPESLPTSFEEETKLGPPSDVFAFGVVILELLTGNKPVMRDSERLVDVFKNRVTNHRDLKDLMKNSPDWNEETLAFLANLASNCVRTDPQQRPSMRDVLHGLLAHLRDDFVEVITASHCSFCATEYADISAFVTCNRGDPHRLCVACVDYSLPLQCKPTTCGCPMPHCDGVIQRPAVVKSLEEWYKYDDANCNEPAAPAGPATPVVATTEPAAPATKTKEIPTSESDARGRSQD